MKRAFVLVLCCCALGFGCAEKSNTPAATANGSTVTTRDLSNELKAINANPNYRDSIDSQLKQQGQPVVGSAPGTFDSSFVAQVLLRQLQFALIRSEVQHRNLTVTDECRQAAKDALTLSVGNNDPQQGQATLAGFPESYRNQLEDWYADEYALQADLVGQPCGTTAVAQAYFDAHTQDFTQHCISLISVNDENVANSIVAQTRAGADFASLAKQYSTEPNTASAGGDAGCLFSYEFPTTLAPTVQGTQVGAVTDPISDNQGGFYIIKVNDRKPAAFADVATDAGRLAARDQSVQLGAWMQHALADAHITVDPRFGTFDPSTGTIKPPGANNSSSPPPATGSEAPPATGP